MVPGTGCFYTIHWVPYLLIMLFTTVVPWMLKLVNPSSMRQAKSKSDQHITKLHNLHPDVAFCSSNGRRMKEHQYWIYWTWVSGGISDDDNVAFDSYNTDSPLTWVYLWMQSIRCLPNIQFIICEVCFALCMCCQRANWIPDIIQLSRR
jgi:hypothetical protein